GFLAAGVIVGPFGLGLWADEHSWLGYLVFQRPQGIAPLAELGVLFLMFMIGLELSAARLWAMRRWVFGAGSAQIAISALLIGGALLLLGQPIEAAVILGLVLSLSSTAVVMQLMNEQHATATPLGQATFAVLMLQDLAVVPLLILIGVMTKGAGAGAATLAAMTLAKAGVAIALIYLAGSHLIRPLFRVFARRHQPDVFMALILLSTLGIAGISAAAGLSMALGALIAGLLLAETEFKHEVELMIEPFRGLLMGLFFMTVGMGMDARQVLDAPLWLAGAVLGLVAIKAAVVALLFRTGGLNWGRAIEGGLLLGQGGEFAFIVIGYAMAGGLVEPALGQRVMLAVGLSLFVTPLLARLGRTIGDRWELRLHADAAHHDEGELASARGRIIIAGYGRVGQMLGKLLAAQEIPFVAFENDARLASELHRQGLPVFFGNASRAELLRRVHAHEAPAIVLTMDHPQSALQAVRGIRREFPEIPLFARARDEQQARLLKLAGATVVVPETLEASLQLSAFVLESLGLEELEVDGIVDEERALFNEALSHIKPTG
ncbi:MAG: cation:proton antiporter, partial [Pseudomonadota bacterium]|nr:cation:proton antiporter [Pseudomonadota bacterium]